MRSHVRPRRLAGIFSALFALTVLVGCAAPAASVGTAPTAEAASAAPAAVPVSAPIPIKVVVVAMFEIGADTGDRPAEFQYWYERQKLSQRFAFPHYHDLFLNPETGVLGMVTGMGTARSASAVMALGLDPRFDLSQAYWLVAGIAGVDPEDASVGSAAWAEWLVDGDLGHEIDAREIPDGWTTGYFARGTEFPYQKPHPVSAGEVFRLNPALTDWAYGLTRDIALPDSEALAAARAGYTKYPNGQKPPFVLKGDNLAAMTYWHGARLNDWANDWVKYWSDGAGEFVTSAMEDTGTMQAIEYLDPTGRVDRDRVMVLRTASNYVLPPDGMTAAENLVAERKGYSGFLAALEAAYVVGATVVDEIVGNWERYADTTPGTP